MNTSSNTLFMATLGTHLYTIFCGKFVGLDEFKNRYYRQRRVKDGAREKRWVIYKREEEASSIPPQWHAWIHHVTDKTPDQQKMRIWPWQKAHQPNMTGTASAYRPQGHFLKGGVRAKAYGDYQAWEPQVVQVTEGEK